MSDNEAALNEFEKRLTSLAPQPARLERDRVLFAAGRASHKRGWYWPFATILASGVAACLGALLIVRPASEAITKTVYVQVPIEMRTSEPALHSEVPSSGSRPPYTFEVPTQPLSFWNMEQQAIRFGVERLPMVASGPRIGGAAFHEGHQLSAGSRPTFFRPIAPFQFGDR